MCLAVVCFQTVPGFPLVVVSNRDEFLERPAAALHFWEENSGVLAGRDLQAGGTWLGGNSNSKLAFLTNVRNLQIPPHPNPRTRGKLVSEFLLTDIGIDSYKEKIENEAKLYEGFNLFLYEKKRALYIGNRPEQSFEIPPGIFAVSNASWDTDWPKSSRAKVRVSQILKESKGGWKEDLFSVFADDSVVLDDALLPQTGLSIEKERALSSIRIKTPHYGTRVSTLSFITETQLVMIERTYPSPMIDLYEERTKICPLS